MDPSTVSNDTVPISYNRSRSSQQLQRQLSILPQNDVSSSNRSSRYFEANMSFDGSIPRLSYIQGRSAPTTPSILSRNSSRSHLNTARNRLEKDISASNYYYAGSVAVAGPHYEKDDTGAIIAPPEGDNMDTTLPRAKSSSTLLSFAEAKKGSRQRLPRDLQPLTSKKHSSQKPSQSSSTQRNRNTTEQMSDSWVHRAGLVIATEARESKGQSWLASRESSISLAAVGDPYELKKDAHASAISSQLTSRFASARQSRHISRRGSSSKDLTNPSNDVSSIDAYGAALRHRLLAEVEAANINEMGPDFVNARDAEELFADATDDEANMDPDVDDIEVARLASEAELGFGLGTWVDWLVGWALFGNVETTDEAQADD